MHTNDGCPADSHEDVTRILFHSSSADTTQKGPDTHASCPSTSTDARPSNCQPSCSFNDFLREKDECGKLARTSRPSLVSYTFVSSESTLNDYSDEIGFDRLSEDLGDLKHCPMPELREDWDMIDKDVPRSLISSEAGQRELEKLLKLYSYRRGRTGRGPAYTQGMSFIASVAMDIAATDSALAEPATHKSAGPCVPQASEEAFTLFQRMIEDVLGTDFYVAHHEVRDGDGANVIGIVEVPLLDCYVAMEGMRQLAMQSFGFDSILAPMMSMDLIAFRWLPAGLVPDLPRELTCAAWSWALEEASTPKGGGPQVIPLILVALECVLPLCEASKPGVDEGLDLFAEICSWSETDFQERLGDPADVLGRARRRYSESSGRAGGWAQVWSDWAMPIWEAHIGQCVSAFQFQQLEVTTGFSKEELRALLQTFQNGRNYEQSRRKALFSRCEASPKFSDLVHITVFRSVCNSAGIDEETTTILWRGILRSQPRQQMQDTSDGSSPAEDANADLASVATLGDVTVGLSRFLKGSFLGRLRFCFDAFATAAGRMDAAGLEKFHAAINAALQAMEEQSQPEQLARPVRISLPGRLFVTGTLSGTTLSPERSHTVTKRLPLLRADTPSTPGSTPTTPIARSLSLRHMRKCKSELRPRTENQNLLQQPETNLCKHADRFLRRLQDICTREGAVDFDRWRELVLSDLALCGLLKSVLGGTKTAHLYDVGGRARHRWTSTPQPLVARLDGQLPLAASATPGATDSRCACLRRCRIM